MRSSLKGNDLNPPPLYLSIHISCTHCLIEFLQHVFLSSLWTYPLRMSSSSSSSRGSIEEDGGATTTTPQPPSNFPGAIIEAAVVVDSLLDENDDDDDSCWLLWWLWGLPQLFKPDEESHSVISTFISGGNGFGWNLLRPRPVERQVRRSKGEIEI